MTFKTNDAGKKKEETKREASYEIHMKRVGILIRELTFYQCILGRGLSISLTRTVCQAFYSAL